MSRSSQEPLGASPTARASARGSSSCAICCGYGTCAVSGLGLLDLLDLLDLAGRAGRCDRSNRSSRCNGSGRVGPMGDAGSSPWAVDGAFTEGVALT